MIAFRAVGRRIPGDLVYNSGVGLLTPLFLAVGVLAAPAGIDASSYLADPGDIAAVQDGITAAAEAAPEIFPFGIGAVDIVMYDSRIVYLWSQSRKPLKERRVWNGYFVYEARHDGKVDEAAMDGCHGGAAPFVTAALGPGNVSERVFECAPMGTFTAIQGRRGSVYDTREAYLMTFVHEYGHQVLRMGDFEVPLAQEMSRELRRLDTKTSKNRILDEAYATWGELRVSRRLFPAHFRRLAADAGPPGSQRPHDLGQKLALEFLDSSPAWGRLWLPTPAFPLGERNFDGAAYSALATRHFILYFRSDPDRAVQIASRLDNLYEHLRTLGGRPPRTPIHAVLAEGRYGRSRTFPEKNAILTGAQGELHFILGSFFHELVHLFNFAVSGAEQDFWSGELFAQFHADRTSTLGRDFRERFRVRLSSRTDLLDLDRISALASDYDKVPEPERQFLMEAGVSVYYFLEERFGLDAVYRFRTGHLVKSRHGDPETWVEAFGKGKSFIQREWRAYYGH